MLLSLSLVPAGIALVAAVIQFFLANASMDWSSRKRTWWNLALLAAIAVGIFTTSVNNHRASVRATAAARPVPESRSSIETWFRSGKFDSLVPLSGRTCYRPGWRIATAPIGYSDDSLPIFRGRSRTGNDSSRWAKASGGMRGIGPSSSASSYKRTEQARPRSSSPITRRAQSRCLPGTAPTRLAHSTPPNSTT